MSLSRVRRRFECGCEWDIIKEDGKVVAVDYDPLKAPLNCPKTWGMLCNGRTLGTFQLETRLGQSFAKKLKPVCIQELADLITIIRPGCLDAIVEEKSLTAHFIDRKHGRDDVKYEHPLLEPVTKDTYGIMISQEQSMLAAQLIAHFSGPESYELIKAIGKKKPELMAKLKDKFISGCVANNVSQEDAEHLFGIIEASQRYSFNFCLDPETTVESKSRGDVTLDEVEVGERILTNEGWAKVKNKFESGVREVWEIVFQDKYKIRTTLQHHFQCREGLFSLEHLMSQGYFVLTKGGYKYIDTIEKIGHMRVVDIEVDSFSHLFFANGILSHNSHAVAYALDNYVYSAYPKAHFPKAFFVAQLDACKTMVDVNDFVHEALDTGVCVLGPDIRSNNKYFVIEGNCIRYGLSKVKHVSESVVDVLSEVTSYEWENLLYNYLPRINSQAVEALIKTGAMDMFRRSRKQMLHEYKTFRKLSAVQKKYLDKSKCLRDNLVWIKECIKQERGKKAMEMRLHEYDNPASPLVDTVAQVCRWEQELLGYSFTYTELDDRNLSISNCTCADFLEGKYNKSNVVRVAVILDGIREHEITKEGVNKGEIMAFASGTDQTGKLSGIVFFPGVYSDFSSLIFSGNRVIIQGKAGRKKTDFVVERVYQL